MTRIVHHGIIPAIITLTVALFPVMASAQETAPATVAEEVAPTLDISGFFDVNAGPLKDRDNPFALGPFELDLNTTLSEHITGSAALVFADGVAEIGVGFIDLHVFSEGQSSSSPRGRIFTDPGYHVHIGQFDIPFGLDYLFYATPDRPTITPPLSTELVFDGGWTDIGIRMFKAHPMLNVSAYMVNGFGEGYATGARIGVRPFENPFSSHEIRELPLLEIGASGALDMGKKSKRQRSLGGADIEMNTAVGRLLGEYMVSKDRDTGIDQRSWYLMAILPIESLGLETVARYEAHRDNPGDETAGTVRRATFAVSKELFHITTFKTEYHRYPRGASRMNEHRDGAAVQFAITF